jgi:ATP-binding cassette subfamily G (WHITE) protein 2 (PDR)
MANEFHNRDFPCAQFIPAGPTYLNATGTERSCLVAGGTPGSDFVNGDAYIKGVYQYEYAHLWRYIITLLLSVQRS